MVEHFREDANVQLVPLSALKPYAGNPRTHSAKQIRQIAEIRSDPQALRLVTRKALDRLLDRMGHQRRSLKRRDIDDAGEPSNCHREKLERWRLDYNQVRPHSALADRSPEWAKQWREDEQQGFEVKDRSV